MTQRNCPRTEKYISYLFAVLKLDDKTFGVLEKVVRKHKILDSFELKRRLELEINVARHDGHERTNLKHYALAHKKLTEYEKEMFEDSDDKQKPSLYCQLR